MIDERFPNWLIDIEKGEIYSLKLKRNIGTIDKKDNYVKVSKQKGYKHCKLHQYIWMTANECDIPEGYDIHHIDGNRQNNSIYNLELIEQHKHRSEHKKGIVFSEEHRNKISKAHKGKILSEETKKLMSDLTPKKKVAQYTLDGELVKIWGSVTECGRNGFNKGAVSRCCNGKLKIYKGFIWKYYNEEKNVA